MGINARYIRTANLLNKSVCKILCRIKLKCRGCYQAEFTGLDKSNHSLFPQIIL